MTESIIHVFKGRRYRATTVKREIPTPYGNGYITRTTTRWELLPEEEQLNLFNG